MKVASSSRITAVSPLWAVEGGRVTVSGSGFDLEPQLPEVRLGGVKATVTHASTRSLSIVVPPGLEWRAHADSRRQRPGRNRVRGSWRANRDRCPSSRQSGVRRGRQSLRHLQRFTRTGSAGLDLRRSSRRIARAVRRRTAQPDIDGHRSARTAARVEPFRWQRAPRCA